jgi:hypothetical protein
MLKEAAVILSIPHIALVLTMMVFFRAIIHGVDERLLYS